MKFSPIKLNLSALLKRGRGAMSRISLAAWMGFGASGLAAALLVFDRRLAVLPLGAFVLLCIAAPFFPAFGFYLPIVSRGRSGRPAVALTFDDGPDPVSTPLLLDLLVRYQARATFFVTGQKAERFPQLIRAIIEHGHAIGNHTYSHDNFIMFKSRKALISEIIAAQHAFQQLGFKPLAFRPPVGITNPRLAKALDVTGLYVVNFSRRAGDMGNRRVKHLSRRILKRLRGDDIILLHDTKPRDKTLINCWLNEVEQILLGISNKGLSILPLAELIGRPVMVKGFAGRLERGRRPPCPEDH